MAERIYDARDMELLKQVFDSKELCSINGKVTHRFEEEFARMMGTKYGVAMNSAMSVLHASVLCSGAGAGSEVICDPVFVFGPMAALYANAVPKFVDIDPDSYAIDPEKLEEAITERTRAVVLTHPWGLPARMDRIVEIAHKHNLLVIEDCAHSILATYKGRYAGSWGDVGSFSLQSSKQMSTGDGGMATTNSKDLARKLDLHAGAPTFHSIASGVHYNYRMNELTAAVGIAQLEKIKEFIEGLKKVAGFYDEAVSGCKWLKVQSAPDAQSSYHYWAATLEGGKSGISVARFRAAIEEAGLPVDIGYNNMPAYKHPAIKERMAHAFHCRNYKKKIEYPDGLCPIAEKTIPRMVIVYTARPEDKAKEEAEKFHQVIQNLSKR